MIVPSGQPRVAATEGDSRKRGMSKFAHVVRMVLGDAVDRVRRGARGHKEMDSPCKCNGM